MLNNVTVFDFETSGLSAENDRVIEIAAIRVVDGEIKSSFNTLVKFHGALDPKITEITGIRQDDLAGGMDELISLKVLRVMMQDSLIVAHNAAFDLAFLHFVMRRELGKTFSNPFIDTLTISRDRHVYPHKLENMCERYGINLDGAHRAFNDVIGCWELLKAMHAESSVDHYVNKLGYLSKYGPPKWAPEYAELVPTENRYENRSAG